MNRKIFVLAVVTALVGVAVASAELSREERKRALSLLKGTLYTRIDVPSQTGRHPYGIYHAALVEVSPQGANTDVTDSTRFGWYHADSTDWSVRVNDAVLAEGEFDDTRVEISLEGTGPSEGRDTSIDFIEIHTFADFEAAFDHTFSRRPLQDEHPDWPAEIRQAIGRRQLAGGMTKRQAFYVVGTPASVEIRKEGEGEAEVEVEIWTLRTQGLQIGFWGTQSGPGGPAGFLRFVDGKLTLDGTKQPGSKVKLD